MEDRCKGCKMNEGGINAICPVVTMITIYGLTNDCPCADCLVKVMCLDTCDKRVKYYGNLYNQRKENDTM